MKKRKRRVLKSDYQLYKIARKYAGKSLKTKEIDKIFGYSPSCTNIPKRVKLFKFIEKGKYKHPSMYWIVRDEIAVTYEDLPDNWRVSRVLKVKDGVGYPENIRGKHKSEYIVNNDVHTVYLRKKILFLVPPNQVSWWKLKQYGGWL